MKKLFLFLAATASVVSVQAQSVGVGTTAPDSAAVLDIFSTNKGVLIPRVLDTAMILKPLEGLIIYNKNSKSPYYYNGKQWLSLGSRFPTATAGIFTDKITYQVTGSGFTTTEMEMLSLSHGVSNPTLISGGQLITSGQSSLSAFSLMKEMDVNSKSFNLASLLGTKLTSIEFKLYAAGSMIPYASYRYRDVIFESYQASGSTGGTLIESIAVAFEIYGFKDWVNNQEFGYSLITRNVTTY